ncbi:Dynamin-2B [Platanthera zijinensis]|uniref:Dynamin-2B n=1 Tax=Platanthera zijinensis TaxID=2320716 RepID=A0AAP0FVK9_9ASPA
MRPQRRPQPTTRRSQGELEAKARKRQDPPREAGPHEVFTYGRRAQPTRVAEVGVNVCSLIAMEAIEELIQLSESMMQASALLLMRTSRRSRLAGVLHFSTSLLSGTSPPEKNGATRAPISIDLQRDDSLSSKSIVLQIDSKSQQVSASEIPSDPATLF